MNKELSEMTTDEVRSKYINVLDFVYTGVDVNDIDTKIQRLKKSIGVTNVHCYGGNETKEEILAILEYTVICEKLS